MARHSPKQVKDAATINANWLAAMGSNTTQDKYRQGIDKYQGNPMDAAASDDAMQRYANNCQRSVTSGKRKAGLAAADPSMWRNNAKQVGAVGLGTGAQKKKAKQLKRAQAWQPIYQAASNAAAAVADDGGMNQGKWAAAVKAMMDAKGKV